MRAMIAAALLSAGIAMPSVSQEASGTSDASSSGESILSARAPASEAAGPLDALNFMAGCWRSDFSGGAVLEEIYTSPSANLMLGLSRYLREGRAVQYEFSRITSDSGGVVLLPYPGGRASEHGFRLTQSGPGSALFEAPEHDFPRRIRYSRGTDGALTARIDGGEGSDRVQEWRMMPAPCPGIGD